MTGNRIRTDVGQTFFSQPRHRDVALSRGLDPGAVKLLDAFYDLESQYGVARGEPFPATRPELQRICGETYPTITKWTRVLIGRGLIRHVRESLYAVVEKKSSLPIPEGDRYGSDNGIRASGKYRGSRKQEDRWGKKSSLILPSLTERRLCVYGAMAALRIPRAGGEYARIVLGQLTKLLKDEHTMADALEVARWARAKYDAGDRFQPLLDLMYLWACSKFSPLLAAARTTPAYRRESADMSAGEPGSDERKAWEDDYQKRIREKGLTK